MLRGGSWILVAILIIGCAPTAKLKVIVRMSPDQEVAFKNKILLPFEKRNRCVVQLKSYNDPAKLPEILASSEDTVDLINPPTSMTRSLIGKNLIMPLNDLLSAKEISDLRKEYYLMDITSIRNQDFFLPRYLETPVIVYLKSQVNEAVQYWEVRKDEINLLLTKYNGKGLPRNFILEKDPSKWDFFDLFVAGFYWSQKEVQGSKYGRIATHPMGSPEAAQSLMDKSFQSGASQEGILRMNDASIVDMFQWQSILAKEGILNPELIKNKWNELQVLQGFQNGEIFLAELSQMEAFKLHGNGTQEMPGFLKKPDDMGIALMPRGSSILVNANGDVQRLGSRNVATRGWWWGVTRQSRNKALAFQLAHYLSSTNVQIEECSVYGMMPIRQDLLSDLGLMFGGGWTANLFQTVSQQLVENRFTVSPLVEEYVEISENYLFAYQELCLPGPGQKTRYEDIQTSLEERFIPRQKQVLGSKYPSRALSAR